MNLFSRQRKVHPYSMGYDPCLISVLRPGRRGSLLSHIVKDLRIVLAIAYVLCAWFSIFAAETQQADSAIRYDEQEKSLTVYEAIALVKQKPKVLTLNDITTLSPDVAAELARHTGALSLNGLKGLSDETAAALSKHRGYLYLGAVTEISDGVASALARHHSLIHLSGLKTITEQQAKTLSRHKGWLYLNGLETCDEATAAILKSKKLILLPPRFR